VATLLLGARAKAQAPPVEAQIKAAFVYNFLKFVVWPDNTFGSPRDSLVVAIIGDGATADAAEQVLKAQQIGERLLVIRRLHWDESLAGVNALLVTERDEKKLRRVLGAATPAVLTIGEGEEFATHGGVIALFMENRRVRFDIDVAVARAAGLQVSSKVLALARAVHSIPIATETRP
jgi:hypothetical protein